MRRHETPLAIAYAKRRGELFDCVVMNPPFAGRRKRWKSLVGLKNLLGLDSVPDVGPVEAGFVLGAIALLRPGGRLLAVLPASLMTSPSTGWVRGIMAGTGAIRHVHELPRFAFPEIESRIYLVVYEKGGQRRKTLLLNHDLEEPEKLVVAWGSAVGAERLDFGYHSAMARFSGLRKRASLGWCRLGELATVWRGTEKTPGIAESVVHTGNYVGGFWRSDPVRALKGGAVTGGRIRAGDILVRRVSRNCARSFGLGVGIRGALASDCVLIVRPRYRVSSARLLFAVRCLMALDFGPGLLERGTGASYLAQGELRSLEVPYGVSRVYRALFDLYSTAVRCRFFEAMQGVESRAARRLLGVRGGEV